MKIFFMFFVVVVSGKCINCSINTAEELLQDISVEDSAKTEETATTETLNQLEDNNSTDLQDTLKFATPCETPNHDPGYCIEIQQCYVLSKQLSNPKAAAFLEESHCGPKNENPQNPKVCCGKYNNYRNVSTHIVDDTKIFPKKCGVQKTILRGRIIGGKEAALGEYPWMALLIHKNIYGYKTYGCSAFLIHPKYVLTAAHCVESSSIAIRGPIYSVSLGEHNIETKIDCTKNNNVCADPVQYSRVAKIMVHPDYEKNSRHHHNDIALIHLRKQPKLTDYVQPICLQTKPNDNEVQKYYLSGWGKTENAQSSATKLKVDIKPTEKTTCEEKFANLNLQLLDSQICAGGEDGKDSCNGDSGGPLMMSPNGTVFYATGVVSYGVGCGNAGWPGVYTNISSFMGWIKTEILANSILEKSQKMRKRKIHANKKGESKNKIKL